MMSKLEELEARVVVIEGRPNILQLDDSCTYLITVPNSTLDEEFNSLKSALAKYHNAVLVACDHIKIIEIS